MSLAPPEASPERIAACPICAGNRLYYVFSTADCRVARCNDCGLFAASPLDAGASIVQPEPAEIEPTTDDERTTSAGAAWTPDILLGWMARYRGMTGGRMIILGSGNTEFMRLAADGGYDVVVVDANAAARERARGALAGHGHVHASLDEVDGGAGSFDVAFLDGALNNTPAPRALLHWVHKHLTRSGAILATAPAVATGARNPSAAPARMPIRPGCFAFGSETLQSVLFQCGYREIVNLPGSRPARAPRTDGPCVVVARPAAVRPRPLLSVVVPAFNEAATVGTTLDRVLNKRIPGVDLEIVIVESNSTDGTREIVQRYAGRERVRVVLEDRPRGKGHAVRTGLKEATGDFILIQDADLEYDLEDYDVLLEPLLAGRESFVLGARHGGQTWKIRQFNDQPLQALVLNLAHGVFTGMINLSLGLSLKDPFTMYKVFRRDCLHGLTFECNRFDFDWELLIKLVRRGHLPLEIPVNYRSRSFKEGKKVSVFRDPITWIVALFRCLSARIDLLDASSPDPKGKPPGRPAA